MTASAHRELPNQGGTTNDNAPDKTIPSTTHGLLVCLRCCDNDGGNKPGSRYGRLA